MLGDIFTDPVGQSVVVGLLVGKTVGIFGISLLAIKLGIATKPKTLELRDMFALSVLGGIGFTVSLLVADLALDGVGDGSEAEIAKAAVLVTSLVASLIGSALLWRRGRVHAARDDASTAIATDARELPGEVDK